VVAEGRFDAAGSSRRDRTVDGASGVCVFPETRYGLEGPGLQTVEVALTVTPDCELVVASISSDVSPPPESAASRAFEQPQAPSQRAAQGVVTRQTGGWHEHYDCCRLLLTESYAHIKYKDNGSRVFGAFGQTTSCYNARDGWFGTGSKGDWTEQRRSIWIWKSCSFSCVGGSYKHTLDVDVYSRPGNDWDVYCTFQGKAVPKAVFKCGKAHYNRI
jgi:hypothetical protein